MRVRRAELAPLEFGGLAIYDYTADAAKSSSLAQIEVPAGAVHGESWSRRSDKYYLVTSGSIAFTLGGEDFVLETGDFCLVERGRRFQYRNAASEPATLVLVHTPSFELDAEVFE